ncbi:glycosyltransferase family 2 protein [Methanocalculus sp.]|uniref:glycosyltransferase family 2 protein n=1 Tax=Methanocalculus sp. TaxID=2004547 RepID=UPI00260DC171|nr:glycosyltransferase family 2 protein [Methanocalculus sp.]MDG6249464.1 glycosyltransferase family 2 protein [Methanocalculus sp.]
MEPYISVVIPVCNEEENILPLYQKLKDDLAELDKTHEIFFIDDGSTDDTFLKLSQLHKNDKCVSVIKLRKNFGKALALNIAFKNVNGCVIVTMDGDLQDDSAEIPKFLEKIDEGYELVSGWKYPRNDPPTKTFPSKLFNRLTCLFTGVNLHDFNCGFKAYRKEVIESINLYGEMHRYTPVLANYYGFKIGEVQVKHHPRKYGRSKYGINRIIKGFFDLISVKFLTSYLSRPLHVFGLPGFLSTSIGFLIGLHLVILKFFYNVELSERPLLLLSVLLIVLGLQFVSLGLLGEMITYREKKAENPDIYIGKELIDH